MHGAPLSSHDSMLIEDAVFAAASTPVSLGIIREIRTTLLDDWLAR